MSHFEALEEWGGDDEQASHFASFLKRVLRIFWVMKRKLSFLLDKLCFEFDEKWWGNENSKDFHENYKLKVLGDKSKIINLIL